jgi:hypothetical protein
MLSAFLPLLAPARADAFWRWLDEMSGPGRFHGVDGELRLWCTGEFRPDLYDSPLIDKKRYAERETRKLERKLRRAKAKKENTSVNYKNKNDDNNSDDVIDELLGDALSGCLFKRVPLDERRKFSIGIVGGYQLAHYTNLEFETGQGDPDPAVHMISLRGSAWWRLCRPVEVGGSAGIYVFDSTLVKPFGQFGFEPAIDIKPLALARNCTRKKCDGVPDSQLDQIFSVRVGLLMMPAGLEAARFKAQGFRTDDGGTRPKIGFEAIPTVTVFVDLESAFRLRRSMKELKLLKK